MPRASVTLRLMSRPAPLRPKNAATKHAVDSWQPRPTPSDRWYWPFATSSIAPCTREPLTSTDTRDGSLTAMPLFERVFGRTEWSFDGALTDVAAEAGTAT